jgi:heme/copper-type cytochrome/quinol oxidase subunit 3
VVNLHAIDCLGLMETCVYLANSCLYMEIIHPHPTRSHSNSRLIWFLSCLVILVGLLFSVLGLSEFYTVQILDDKGAYPWGNVNENAWYYTTPTTYSIYHLISGLLFLLATTGTARATIRKNKKIVIGGIGLIVFFLFAEMISANIR